MGLLERISGARSSRSITTIDDYITAVNQFVFNGSTYPLGGALGGYEQSMGSTPSERITNDLVGYAQAAYAANGPVFAVMAVRQLVFSAIRFRWTTYEDGKPSRMFGSPDLGMVERPWLGGTTQDLLNRTIQYADLAGNAYTTRYTPLSRLGGDDQPELVSMRPDWTEIVLTPRIINGGRVGWRKLGYLYTEGGFQSGADPVPFLPSEVAHFAPHPDPLAAWRGMSWLTPVIRELRNDKQMLRYQSKFFENNATVNMLVKVPKEVSKDKFLPFKELFEAQHVGPDNAFKPLFLGGGADATVVGSNFEQMTFTDLQAVSETRIAMAGGVPPVIAGMAKGLESATYSNYGQARRRFADGTMHPLWQNVSGSFEPLLEKPRASAQIALTYDASNVPFLREDEKDAADIAFRQSQTIRNYLDSGFTWESSVDAVENNDRRLLVHTGLFSVQLQKPGTSESVIVRDRESIAALIRQGWVPVITTAIETERRVG
jgi:hypothetical protein